MNYYRILHVLKSLLNNFSHVQLFYVQRLQKLSNVEFDEALKQYIEIITKFNNFKINSTAWCRSKQFNDDTLSKVNFAGEIIDNQRCGFGITQFPFIHQIILQINLFQLDVKQQNLLMKFCQQANCKTVSVNIGLWKYNALNDIGGKISMEFKRNYLQTNVQSGMYKYNTLCGLGYIVHQFFVNSSSGYQLHSTIKKVGKFQDGQLVGSGIFCNSLESSELIGTFKNGGLAFGVKTYKNGIIEKGDFQLRFQDQVQYNTAQQCNYLLEGRGERSKENEEIERGQFVKGQLVKPEDLRKCNGM